MPGGRQFCSNRPTLCRAARAHDPPACHHGRPLTAPLSTHVQRARAALRELALQFSHPVSAAWHGALPFPSLARLELRGFAWDPAWLQAALAGLRSLRHLDVQALAAPASGPSPAGPIPGPAQPAPPPPLALPRLPHLASLGLTIAGRLTMRVHLGRLPALERLSLHGTGRAEISEGQGEEEEAEEAPAAAVGGSSGSAAAPGPEPAPEPAGPSGVRDLMLACSSAEVHFGALPALDSLSLSLEKLEGAGGLWEAKRLRRLQLSPRGLPAGQGWVPELLRAAPPSLSRCAGPGAGSRGWLSLFTPWGVTGTGRLPSP